MSGSRTPRVLLLLLAAVFLLVVVWPLLAPVVAAVVARIVFGPVHERLMPQLGERHALTAALVEGIALYREGLERDLASAASTAVTSGSDPATPPG